MFSFFDGNVCEILDIPFLIFFQAAINAGSKDENLRVIDVKCNVICLYESKVERLINI